MAEDRQNLVGERVRKLRDAAKVSQKDFIARCQMHGWIVSRGTFAKIEAGLRRVNDAEVLVLAKALKCSVEDLFEGITLKRAAHVARNGETNG